MNRDVRSRPRAVASIALSVAAATCLVAATPRGSAPAEVPQSREPSPTTGSPDSVRACGRILAAAWEEKQNRHSIWTFRPDGGDRTRLVRLPAGISVDDPLWSPDGRWVAYIGGRTRDGSERPSLFLIRPDGTDKTRLGFVSASSEIQWSPSGTRIVAASTWGGVRTMWLFDLQGNRAALGRGVDPTWSPLDSIIAYDSGRIVRGGGALFLHDLTTGVDQQITQPEEASDSEPVWSPDGRTILFLRYPAHQSGEDGPFADLWSLDVATGTTTQITDRQNDLNGVWKATWSPSGQRITYSPEADDYMETVVSRPDGTQPIDIHTREFFSRDPDWSPDDRSIAFLGYEGIRVADARTGHTRLIAPHGDLYWNGPDWAPC
jgi:Tol biopolymer transport system component